MHINAYLEFLKAGVTTVSNNTRNTPNMGSLHLSCPLCCDETFPSHSSLKFHLLSMIDNLICTICGERFDNIYKLAEHIGRECKKDQEELPQPIGNKENSQDTKLEIKKEIDCSNDSELGNLLNNSILAKALLKNTSGTNPNENGANENPPVEEDELFYCSSCAISFPSVEEHLQAYHQGHEVFIEGSELPEEQSNDPIVRESELEGEDEVVSSCEIDEETPGNDTKVKNYVKMPQVLDTLQQQDCFDRDGRLYTRKVVKIEKFWDESVPKTKPKVRKPPITQKYELTGKSTAKKISDVEAAKITDKSVILEVHQCELCLIQFSKLDAYYGHKCRAEAEQYTCQQCKAFFNSSKSLCAHMKIHRGTKVNGTEEIQKGPFICSACATEFPTYKSLRLHKRMHEPIKNKEIEAPVSYGMMGEEIPTEVSPGEMFICKLCNKSYNKEYEEAHKHFHSKETSFDCETCNRKFFSRENLDMHIRAHTKGKKFVCSYCKKGFLTADSLKTHVTKQCQKRQYECQFCGRRFSRPHEKVKHERIHTGERPHVCEICGKSFRVSYCLTLHMRTHSGTRPYQCQHCGKRFKAHSVYNHHLLTHSDVRAYQCPYCPKAFKTGVQLAGHKNSHTKPFTCTECNRPFASLYAVRAHMETHQRQNNLKYSCWLCGASYARAFALRDHIKEQHAEEGSSKVEAEMLESEQFEESIESGDVLHEESENMLIDLEHGASENVEMSEEIHETM